MTDEKIKEAFLLFADEPVSPEAKTFGEDMFVEWEGNEKTRLEAQGFYAGFRAAERLAKIEVLEKLIETHELSPKTYPEIIQDMLSSLKAGQ